MASAYDQYMQAIANGDSESDTSDIDNQPHKHPARNGITVIDSVEDDGSEYYADEAGILDGDAHVEPVSPFPLADHIVDPNERTIVQLSPVVREHDDHEHVHDNDDDEGDGDGDHGNGGDHSQYNDTNNNDSEHIDTDNTHTHSSSLREYVERPSFLRSPSDASIRVTRMSTGSDLSPTSHSGSPLPATNAHTIQAVPFHHPHYRSPSEFFAAKSGRLGTLSGSRNRPSFSTPIQTQTSTQVQPHSQSQPLSQQPQLQLNDRSRLPVARSSLGPTNNSTSNNSRSSLSSAHSHQRVPSHSHSQSLYPSQHTPLTSASRLSASHAITQSYSQPVSPTHSRADSQPQRTLYSRPSLQSVGGRFSSASVNVSPTSRRINRSLAFDSPSIQRQFAHARTINGDGGSESLIVTRVDSHFQSIVSSRVQHYHRYVHFDCATSDSHWLQEQLADILLTALQLTSGEIVRQSVQRRERHQWTWLVITAPHNNHSDWQLLVEDALRDRLTMSANAAMQFVEVRPP